MEIEFFGVSGTSIDDSSLAGVSEAEPSTSLFRNIQSHHFISFDVLGSKDQIKQLDNVDIQQIIAN